MRHLLFLLHGEDACFARSVQMLLRESARFHPLILAEGTQGTSGSTLGPCWAVSFPLLGNGEDAGLVWGQISAFFWRGTCKIVIDDK